ncbi:uncharacterized protein B0I36DRAFT_340200, partial [Microdochium trichocladiopsis]
MLRSYSLISTDETGAVLGMHSLVQLATRNGLVPKTEPTRARSSLCIGWRANSPLGTTVTGLHAEHCLLMLKVRLITGRKVESCSGSGRRFFTMGSGYAQSQGRYRLAGKMAKQSRDA